MRVKVRNPKYDQRHLYSFYIPEFQIYEGEQVPTFKWAEPGTICLTTGDSFFPIRQLHPDFIVSIDEKPVEPRKKVEDTRLFQVAGSKGQTYTVTVGPSGKSCTCTGYGFRKSCKHILSVDIS
jgi:hypothetical protein